MNRVPADPVPGLLDPSADRRVRLSDLIVAVYLPMLTIGLVLAMLVAILPLYLVDRGIDFALGGAIVAAAGVGSALAALPTGAALVRFGERAVLVASFALLAISIAVIGFVQAVVVLFVVRTVAGVSRSAIRLSRQHYVTHRVPASQLGRAMALIGGAMRIGFAVGPFVAGWLVEAVGYRDGFVVVGCIAALGLGPAWLSDRLGPPLHLGAAGGAAGSSRGLIEGVRRYWKRLVWAGGAPVLIMTARSGRFVALTWIGEDTGMGLRQIGATLAVSTAADLVLFPVAGWVMDRYGRLRAMVPAFSLMAVGLVMLGTADSVTAVVVAGAVIGVGNGLSSGAMLTLASDLAPADAVGPFLAGMSTMQDLGNVAGPVLVGVVGESMGLGTSAFVLAAVMALGVAWLVWVIGESGSRPPVG